MGSVRLAEAALFLMEVVVEGLSWVQRGIVGVISRACVGVVAEYGISVFPCCIS